jgi:hypothetical protein
MERSFQSKFQKPVDLKDFNCSLQRKRKVVEIGTNVFGRLKKNMRKYLIKNRIKSTNLFLI